MKRIVVFGLLSALLTIELALAQETPPSKPGSVKGDAVPPPAPKYPLDAWKQLVAKEGNFSILLPITPKDETTRYRLQTGSAEEHRFTVPTTEGNYQVSYTYISDNLATPEAIRARFQTLLKDLKGNSKIKWISGGDIAVEGNPGIEFKLQLSESHIFLWSRQFFAYGCVYVMTTRYVSKEPELTEPGLFMESFKLLGPPIRRPINLDVPQESLPDFTPLAQNIYYISAEKLRAQALEQPEPKIDVKGKVYSGSITLLLTISPEGKVLQAEPIRGFIGFNNEAIKAARKWTFKPFLLEGKPVKVQGQLIFKIGGQ